MFQKKFTWDESKNDLLKRSRGVAFEDVLIGIARRDVVRVIYRHNPGIHPGQDLLLIMIRDYLYAVPHQVFSDTIRLITIYPSRVWMTRLGLSRRS